MKKTMIALLLCTALVFSLMMGCTYAETAEAATPDMTQVTPYFAVYSYSTERMLYPIESTTASLSLNTGDNYVAFCFRITNFDAAAKSYKNVYATIDGGQALYWNDFPLNSGESTDLHIFNVHMKNVVPGIHAVNFYANNELFASELFTLNRDWGKVMTLPTEEQLSARNVSSREFAPFAASSYTFPESGYHQFAVDFKADFIPAYTFLCPISWDVDSASVKSDCLSIDASRTAYAGFQTTDNGTLAVMYVKDAGYTDKNGNPGLIRAKLTYTKPDAAVVESFESSEGSIGLNASGCRLSFELVPGHWYRALIQYNVSAQTGNTTAQYWINDLSVGNWILLMEFDLGIKDTYMSTFGSFVENFGANTSATIRTLELANARGLKEDTWQSAQSVAGSIGSSSGLVGSAATSGSYAFSCDGSIFGMITSGVAGLGNAQAGTEFEITECESGSPF